jgi:CheY-like chemotaxis protein
MGAVGALPQPLKSKEALAEAFARINAFTAPRTRNVLVVNHDETARDKVLELLAGDTVQVHAVGTGREALAALKDKTYEAVVLELDQPDMSGFELIEKIDQDPALRDVPLIAYVSRELSRKDAARLKRLGHTLNLKEVCSAERLLDHVLLLLHCEVGKLPEFKRQILQTLHESDTALVGRNVLIVDDDIRNVFAVTSLLERYQMQILSAENGKAALQLLHSSPDIDAVLMDIMMPGMDGYDTIRAIRQLDRFRTLPIIALTSKAMTGDREKCIDAGASDYIAKPVNGVELVSRLRLWLQR